MPGKIKEQIIQRGGTRVHVLQRGKRIYRIDVLGGDRPSLTQILRPMTKNVILRLGCGARGIAVWSVKYRHALIGPVQVSIRHPRTRAA